MNPVNILLVDDETGLRTLLRSILTLENYQVIEASTGQEGLHHASIHRPDLILLDLGLPDMTGQQVLKELRSWYTRPILIVSADNRAEEIVLALDNGANDFITKPFNPDELLARIRVARRHSDSQESSESLMFGDLQIDLKARLVTKSGQVVKLTSTEYELLRLFAIHEGKALTHQFLLRQVWGPDNEADVSYLRVFVGNLRKKIEDQPNQPTLLHTESGVGYRFLGLK